MAIHSSLLAPYKRRCPYPSVLTPLSAVRVRTSPAGGCVQLVVEDGLAQGDVIVVFFSIIMGAMAIGQAAPSFASFAAGRGAAYTVLETIGREPEIDSLSEVGQQPESLQGRLSFHDVKFQYPTRPDEPVLKGLSFEVRTCVFQLLLLAAVHACASLVHMPQIICISQSVLL